MAHDNSDGEFVLEKNGDIAAQEVRDRIARILSQLPDGTQQPVSSIYVFWFVTENQATASFPEVMRSMLFHLVRHGVLQRWAYVSWFSACPPGREEATYARMKELVVASVPEFQQPLPPAK